MLNTWHLLTRHQMNARTARYGMAKNYIHVQNTTVVTCTGHLQLLIYYLAFPLMLKSYNFQQYYIRRYF